jgi:hypothetical protein
MEMHFFKKSISFIAVMCVFGAAYPAARVAMTTVNAAAARRLPTLANALKAATSSSAATATSSTTSSSTTVTGNSLLPDADCIDNYRDCMKSDSACGSEFEECTTNVLFHGHMSECVSTLYQCSPAAINRLFGTSNLNALSDVKAYVDGTNNTEIDSYVYPTAGSIMEIDISGAATRNKLSTADCVKKYKRCLNKDNVCGEDFELCTSDDEFKKQAAMCDSTLARCQKEGFQQIFGEKITTKPSHKGLKPNADGDANQWINDGAALAAANAVNTCYKVVDTCFANACASNPYSCVEDVNWAVVNAAKSVGIKEVVTMKKDGDKDVVDGKQTATDVRKFFRAACTDTIGANQYCFMTFNEGKKPTKTDLQDEDVREDIFGEAYASRKTILTTKVNELVKQFDKTATSKCLETFKSCAVQSCGGGSGAVCYSRAFQPTEGSKKSINNDDVYPDIENGCAAVVNTDANCQFMAAMQDQDTSDVKITNVYKSNLGGDYDAFSKLFPTYRNGNADSPIVAALNAELSTAYNDVAIENMKKQCQNVVSNCVKSMCGKDYMNCYRNRSDISVSTYATESVSFNKSMNKVGGVLDYTIVQGLCMSTVKTADACAESLAIAKAGLKDGSADVTAGWGSTDTTLSGAWRDSSKNYGNNITQENALVQATDANGNKLCTCENTDVKTGICGYESVAGANKDCQKPYLVERDAQLSNLAATTLFQTVLADIELEAQAKYNAKLTHEQNVCLAQNGASGIDPAFVWAKLKSGNRPSADYATKGFGDAATVASNDLYNSFCRVKVTIQSSDKNIQAIMASVPNAYFAVGDPFTCGSWLNTLKNSDGKLILEEIAKTVAAEKTGTNNDGDLTKAQKWGVAGVSTLSSIAGIVGTDLLQEHGGLGGFLGTTKIKNQEKTQKELDDAIKECKDAVAEVEEAAAKYTKNTKKVCCTSETSLICNQKTTDCGGQFSKEKDVSDVNASDVNKMNSTLGKLKTKYESLLKKLDISSQSKWNDALKNDFQNNRDDNEKAKAMKTALKEIKNHCDTLEKSDEYKDLTTNGEKNFWNNGGGRAVVDITGGALLGTAGGITTAQIMKAKNRSNFTAEQQKWLDEIGSKIHCYVGGQSVGDFGDTISIDITEE